MSESNKTLLRLNPPLLTQYRHDGHWYQGLGAEASKRGNLAGPIDTEFNLSLSLLTAPRIVGGVNLSAGVTYNNDSPEQRFSWLPDLTGGITGGTDTDYKNQFPASIGGYARIGLLRVGPFVLSAGGSYSYPENGMLGLNLGTDVSPKEDPPSKPSHIDPQPAATPHEAVAEAGESSMPSMVRPDFPLSAGFVLGEFKNNRDVVAALAQMLGVTENDLALHFGSSDTLKPDDLIIANSRLAGMVAGGGESVIGILRSITPDRDHVLDEREAEIFYGMVQKIGKDLFANLEKTKNGEVSNDFQNVPGEVLPRAFTGIYYPHALYPNISPDKVAETISQHGQYEEWGAGYKFTIASQGEGTGDGPYLWFYLEDTLDAYGIDYNLPIKKYGLIRANTWVPAFNLLTSYETDLAENLSYVRKDHPKLKPVRTDKTYGGWVHIPLVNGDTYCALYSFASPDQSPFLLRRARDTVMEKTAMTYVKFAHGIGERSKNPAWHKPNGDDWDIPFFKLGKGTSLKSYK